MSIALAMIACGDRGLSVVSDGGIGEPGSVACASVRCAGGAVCCLSGAMAGCAEDQPSWCIGGTIVRCDGPEDCQTRTCCLSLRNVTSESMCAAHDSCEAMSLQTMCHIDDDCPSSRPHCCPQGTLSVCAEMPCP